MRVVISNKRLFKVIHFIDISDLCEVILLHCTVVCSTVVLTVHVYPDGGGDGLGVVVVGAPTLQHAAHVSPGQVLQLHQHNLH